MPARLICDDRSLRPAPNSTAVGTDDTNFMAIISPSRTSVVPATRGLIEPRCTMDDRNGATATVISTAMIPDTEKNTLAVRMTSATPSRSPSAVIRATRWTAAVDTPASSSPR